MSQPPVDTDYVVEKVKGTTAGNVGFWLMLGIGVLVVMGIGKISRVLGLVGFGAYLLFAAWQVLSLALSLIVGIATLDTSKLWVARAISAVETAGVCLLTFVLYRHFY